MKYTFYTSISPFILINRKGKRNRFSICCGTIMADSTGRNDAKEAVMKREDMEELMEEARKAGADNENGGCHPGETAGRLGS